MRVRKMIGAVAGLAMIGALMASAASAQSDGGDVVVEANNESILELLLPDHHDFGSVAPDGSVGGPVHVEPGVGAYYCSAGHSATVISNQPWTLTLVQLVAVSGGNMNLSNLSALVPTDNCDAGSIGSLPWGPPILGPTPATTLTTGGNTSGFTMTGDVWLRSLWTNTPGDFQATLTIELTA